MKRFTTDNPDGNIETALNLFYIKDKETWVRGGGKEPDYSDISLDSFIKNLCKTYRADIDTELDLEEFSCEMAELLSYGPEDIEGLLAVLYTAGWAFAELRHKLMEYEDSGLTPDQVKRMRWIPVEEGLPKEHDSFFAKFKDTPKWNSNMWEKASDNCNVIVRFEDGSRMVTSGCVHDGKWFLSSISAIQKGTVTHWMPKPEFPKGG